MADKEKLLVSFVSFALFVLFGVNIVDYLYKSKKCPNETFEGK